MRHSILFNIYNTSGILVQQFFRINWKPSACGTLERRFIEAKTCYRCLYKSSRANSPFSLEWSTKFSIQFLRGDMAITKNLKILTWYTQKWVPRHSSRDFFSNFFIFVISMKKCLDSSKNFCQASEC
jgi:hypothetical protein